MLHVHSQYLLSIGNLQIAKVARAEQYVPLYKDSLKKGGVDGYELRSRGTVRSPL